MAERITKQMREDEMVPRRAWVRFLNDAAFHAEVTATVETLRRGGIEVSPIKAATILNCAEQTRAALSASDEGGER